MKSALIIALSIASFIAPSCAEDDESAEPSQTLTLTIDGKPHAIEPGKQVEVPGKFENPKVILTASAIRTFSYGGLKFDYPATFGWEAEIEPFMKTWTLEGNDLTIIIFAPIITMEFDDMISGMKEQMGAKDTKSEKCKRRFGTDEVEGQVFTADAFGAKVKVETYSIKTAKGPRLVVLQDSPTDDDAESDEAKSALKLISESFSVAK